MMSSASAKPSSEGYQIPYLFKVSGCLLQDSGMMFFLAFFSPGSERSRSSNSISLQALSHGRLLRRLRLFLRNKIKIFFGIYIFLILYIMASYMYRNDTVFERSQICFKFRFGIRRIFAAVFEFFFCF
jgi:hypothetical protein